MAERLTDHCYRTIDPTKLILTISKMADRVEEHFPGSGLSSVANEVAAVAEGTVERVTEIKKPRMGLRIMVGFMVLLVVSGPFLFSILLSFSGSMNNLSDFLQATDAGLHMLLVLAGSIKTPPQDESWSRELPGTGRPLQRRLPLKSFRTRNLSQQKVWTTRQQQSGEYGFKKGI